MIFSKIACPRSCWLHWHRVGVVVDYPDTCWNSRWQCGHDVGVVVDYIWTPQWLCGHFRKTLKASHRFKGPIRGKKVLGCVYTPNSNNLKIWKTPYLKKHLRFSNFAMEYLGENEKFTKLFCLILWGRGQSFKQKHNNGRKSFDTVTLKLVWLCHNDINLRLEVSSKYL